MAARLAKLSLFLFLAGLVTACEKPRLITITGNTMGTTYSVKISRGADGTDIAGIDEARLKAEIDAELVRINDLMSTYIEDSEISRFNRAPVGEWMPVSGDMLFVLDLARSIYGWSNGAFDVTVGPLVNLWGFGPTPGDRQVPPENEIAEAMDRVGLDLVVTDGSRIRKTKDVYLDLSAIAKGYGVDRIAEILAGYNIENFLVEIGGELRGKGVNERGTPWRIAIERPEVFERAPFRTLTIDDMAIATSGDYRNFFEVDGKRYSHMINPVTGHPITHNLASVTVVAPTCALADGVATAISILGVDKGIELAEEQNLAVFVIMKTESGFAETHSSAFEEHLDD